MNWKSLSFERKTAVIFIAALMVACISPVIHAPHNNYTAFNSGTLDILGLVDPYPPVGASPGDAGNWFLYSPTFAVFFLVFSTKGAGMYAGVYLWLMLNLFTFFFGFFSILRHIEPKASALTGWWFAAGMALMFNELQGTLLNLQSNCLMVGLTMMGTAMYMERRFAFSSFLLAVGVSFKLFPLVMALLLFLEFNRRFILSFFGFLALLTALPLVFIPPDFYLSIAGHWLKFILAEPAHPDFLGFYPTLLYYGTDPGRQNFFMFMMANALGIAYVARAVFVNGRKEFPRLLLPLALAFIVVFNNRAEKPSFILLAPIFVIMLDSAVSEWKRGNFVMAKFHAGMLALGWGFISYVYSDLFPYSIRQVANHNHWKTFGALVLYAWAWIQPVVWLVGKARGGEALKKGKPLPEADYPRG